jgi:hypothetical protein
VLQCDVSQQLALLCFKKWAFGARIWYTANGRCCIALLSDTKENVATLSKALVSMVLSYVCVHSKIAGKQEPLGP